MQPEERQHKIDLYLQQVEFASLEELAAKFDASVSTVRRDLSVLESKGNVRRTHGGARVIDPRSDEFIFSARDTHQLTEKEAIGKAVAGLVRPRESVIVDAGTTPYHAARHLEAHKPQIITNSLPVANLFASSSMVEVVVSGGVLYPRLGVLVGPLAVEAFSEMHADVAVMGGGGIAVEGISNSHVLLIEIQRAMMRAARRVIFCLDHTKLGRRSMSALCSLGEIDVLVTDDQAPTDVLAELRSCGLEILVAPA